MSTAFIITMLKLLNAVFCLFLIGLSIWHNAKSSVHSKTLIAFMITLLLLLIGQIVFSNNYETISVFFTQIIILLLLLNVKKLDSNNKPLNTPIHSEDLINQAKEQERSRIYANLHDDVGAKLLELIYTVKDDESKKMAKQVLSDIRQAVASTINVKCSVHQLSNEIFQESEMRLNSASIILARDLNLNNPKQHLAASVPAVISRICREVISNTIKHSQASQVTISMLNTEHKLIISIKDNGVGFSGEKTHGKGLKTIRKRALSISSMVEWKSQPKKGTEFILVYEYGNH